jgi:hypothetical protein
MVYYYTYGSVLAALSRPKDNKCGEALAVMEQVWAFYQANAEYRASDPSVPGIVQTAQIICSGLGVTSPATPVTQTSATEAPASTSTPEAGEAATPTTKP